MPKKQLSPITIERVGGKVEVTPSWIDRGLAVTPALVHSGHPKQRHWVITHVQSGLTIGCCVTSQKRAIALAKDLVARADWDRDAKVASKDKAICKVRTETFLEHGVNIYWCS